MKGADHMAKIKVGLIGCGGIGNFHLDHLTKMDDVQVSGVCDILPDRAEKANQRTGGKIYADYREMLEKEKFDAAFVCVPPHIHPDIELEVIKRGVNLFIQKPMALSMDIAGKVCGEIKKAGIINAVGFQDRYLNVTDEIVSWLGGKKTGMFRGAWLGGVPGVYWWQKKSTCGGQIVEQNIHIYDMARMFFGEPARVSGYGGADILKHKKGAVPEDFDLEEYTSVNMVFKNGVVGNIFTGCFLTAGGRSGMDIFTDDGCAYYNLRNSVEFEMGGKKTVRYDVNNDNGFDCDRTFIDAVIKNDQKAIRSPYADSLESLRFVLAAQKAVETGCAIEL